MNSLFFIPIITTVLFVAFQFVYLKYVEKNEEIPIKDLIKNSIVVCLASVIASIGYTQFQPYINDFFSVVTTGGKGSIPETTAEIFTDGPKF
jgi:hypothetical protein